MNEFEWLNSTEPDVMLDYVRPWATKRQLTQLAHAVTDHVINKRGTIDAQPYFIRDIFGNPFRPVSFDCNCGADRTGPSAEAHDSNCPASNESWLTSNVLAIAKTIRDEQFVICERCEGSGDGHGAGVTDEFGRDHCSGCDGTGKVSCLDDMTILADALEEAGCDCEELLQYLRGEERCPRLCYPTTANFIAGPRSFLNDEGMEYMCDCDTGWIPLRGPHTRGCWALELILD